MCLIICFFFIHIVPKTPLSTSQTTSLVSTAESATSFSSPETSSSFSADETETSQSFSAAESSNSFRTVETEDIFTSEGKYSLEIKTLIKQLFNDYQNMISHI